MSNQINFHYSSPIFRVSDLSASLEYYKTKLGFYSDWIYEKIIASVSRDSASIWICQGDQGNGKAWVYIGVGDVKKLYEELKSSGAIVRQKPTNFPWAMEIQIEDPDGNVIRFGSEPEPGVPFGPWMDMNGKFWKVT